MSEPRPQRLTQQQVDTVRQRVHVTMLVEAVRRNVKRPPVKHLRFHKPRTDGHYELRDGNPPSDSERYAYERGLRLEVDVGVIDESIARAVRHLLKEARESGEAAPAWSMDTITKLVMDTKQRSKLWVPGDGSELLRAPAVKDEPKMGDFDE